MIREESVKKKNRVAFILVLVALVLAVICMLLPAYHFDVSLYTKKALDSTIGSEKYLEVKEQVVERQEALEAKGFDIEYHEEEVTKTNGLGETSTYVLFNLNKSYEKGILNFLGMGLTSSYIVMAIILLMVLSVGLMIAGLIGTSDEVWSMLDGRSKAFRTAAGYCLLIAALLVPVFYMVNTYVFSRKIDLLDSGLLDLENAQGFYEKLDYFFFDGKAGLDTADLLKKVEFKSTALSWMVLPSILVMLLGSIQIRHGAIKNTLMKGLLYAFIVVVCIITLYPYYVMLITGFRSPAEANDMYFLHIFPTKWIWSNINDIVKRGVLRYLLNSLLISGGATVIALFCGIPAAYSMARMRYKGRKAFLGFVIMSQMFSPVVLLIGIAQLMDAFGLTDSIVGLMLINAAFNQAFAIWLLRGTFISISPEMEKAGKIDGCNTVGALWHILLPMAAPGIVTTLIFVFINAWNEYTVSTILISTIANKPITVGITTFSSFNMIEWQYLFAASLLATIPVVILFMCIEKHLADGLTSGGVKG